MTHEPKLHEWIGRSVDGGRYKLEAYVGGGAFGEVFRATEFVLGKRLRNVALKLTRATHLRQADAHELLAEAWTLAEVAERCEKADARKHLVQVYGVGLCPELDGRAYLAMEFVRGVRLLDHIRGFGGGLPIATARRLMGELCCAVAACHKQGLLHCDLKPDNLLIDETATLRVVDFGLARHVSVRAGFAPGGIGTRAYQAPEVVEGEAIPQSDVYSIGLIFYEALRGGGPHLQADLHSAHLPPSELRRRKEALVFDSTASPGASDEERALLALVLRCCAADYGSRPASAEDVVRELEQPPSAAPHPRDAAPGPARDDRPQLPAVQPTPPADWRARAFELLDRGQYAEGREFLGSLRERDSAHARAMAAVFRERLGEHARVSASDAQIAEELLQQRDSHPRVVRELLAALERCARAGKQDSASAYYAGKLREL